MASAKHRVETAAVGVVLAGGASRRMGRDKARLLLDKTTLAEGAAERLKMAVSEVVVADRGRRLVPGHPSVTDGPGGGPAAGILGAAQVHPRRDLLILACDLPAVPAGLLRRLAAAAEDERFAGDVFAPRWERGIEPLCALYRPSALAALRAEVHAGRFALHNLLRLESLTVRTLEGPELTTFGSPEDLFRNLNTPEDLARLARPAAAKID